MNNFLRIGLRSLCASCLWFSMTGLAAAQDRMPLPLYPQYPLPQSQRTGQSLGDVSQDHCCESPALHAAVVRSGKSGLLGRQYLRSSYQHVRVNDPVTSLFDDSLQGFDIEYNTPLPWLSSDRVGVDLSTEYDLVGYSGTNAGNSLDIDGHSIFFGTRIFLRPTSRLKPYVTLGVSFLDLKIKAGNAAGGVFRDAESDIDFTSSLGTELNLTDRLSARVDFEVVPDDLKSGFFEGTLVFWATDSLFIRGGVLTPFEDDGTGTGGTIGGGLSF